MEDHELTAGGHVSYYMTGPEGDKMHGWWKVLEAEPPRLLVVEDGFADETGTPNPAMPTTVMRVEIIDRPGGVTTSVVPRFPYWRRWSSSSAWAWRRACSRPWARSTRSSRALPEDAGHCSGTGGTGPSVQFNAHELYSHSMDVPVSTLRAELSAWIERVRAGEEIVVTDRGTPVARLLPVDTAPLLDQLVQRGVLSKPRRAVRPDARGAARVRASGPVGDLVSEQRDGRA